MKHIGAILIKFIMTAVILEIVLQLVTALNWVEILTISVAVTVITYLIGDLLILAISNNIVATIADVALAFVILYFYNYRFGYGAITYGDAIIAAVVLGVGEWFFHKYMAGSVLPNRRHRVREIH